MSEPLFSYSDGTLSVSGGSATVTGSGTAWSTQVKPGDAIVVVDGNEHVEIGLVGEVDGDLELTLQREWPGSAISGAEYYTRRGIAWLSGAAPVENMVTLMARLAGMGLVSATDGQPAASDGRENELRVDLGNGRIWFKQGGSWQSVDLSSSALLNASDIDGGTVTAALNTVLTWGLGVPTGRGDFVDDMNDLPEYTHFGRYAGATANAPPVGGSNGIFLHMIGTGNPSRKIQFTFNHSGQAQPALRYYNSSTEEWTDWVLIQTEDDMRSDNIANDSGFDGSSLTDALNKAHESGISSESAPTPPNNNLDDVVETGFTRANNDTVNSPDTFGCVYTIRYNSNGAVQLFIRTSSPTSAYLRKQQGGVWEDWQRIITDTQIVGTVSESGGIPTGAIIERGSNSNGEYVRFADGTQICWRQETDANISSAHNTSNFSAPAQFSNAYPVAAALSADNVVSVAIRNQMSETAIGFRATGSDNHWNLRTTTEREGVSGDIVMTAIGRWF